MKCIEKTETTVLFFVYRLESPISD